MNGRERISELEFFKKVSKATINRLWASGRIESYSKGSVIRRAKELDQNVYIQVTGKSAVYNLTHTGKRKIIFIFGRGTLLNSHVFKEHVSSLFIETIENSQIFSVPTDIFIQSMKDDFTLVEALLSAQEKKIWRLGHQLKNTMGSIYMERKLAAKLWKLSRDFGKETSEGLEIDFNMSITFLADMLGAPRETTSRLCSTLVENGLIKINKKRITIIDHDRMAHFYKTGEYK